MIPVIGTIVNRLRKAIAIVEDGDTASQTIAKGKYIVWKGELCQTDSAITQGGTFATSGAGKNLTAKTEGLGGEIATLNSNINDLFIAETKNLTINANGYAEVGAKANYSLILAYDAGDGGGCIIYKAGGVFNIWSQNIRSATRSTRLIWAKVT